MNITTYSKINRRPEVLERIGLSKSTLFNRIKLGTFPPPISLGCRAVGWLEHEVDATLSLMSAGYNENQLKALVSELINKRKEGV